jgi:UDP-N-acetylenolpyruvoylglucosamine reductase
MVDDYAHHPTEIRATISAARTLSYRRIIAAFQPHRYTRTQALRDEFATAFTKADKLFLTDVYAASEPPIAGVNGETIRDAVLATGQREVIYEPDLDALAGKLADEARPGDLLLIMGAGNIYQVAESVAGKLRERGSLPARNVERDLRSLLSKQSVVRANEPMAKHTTMRVGGPAELWVEPWDETDLAKLLKFCHAEQVPIMLIGRGTNMLVRDGGIAGVVCQLSSEEFTRVAVDGERIIARGGARLKNIVNAAKQHELGGFEFLEGIPGSLGGALRMNAGAMGQQTFGLVDWVRYMSLTGEVYDADAKTIPVNYRSCPLFTSHVAVTAILRGQKVARAQIDARLREYSERRWATQPKEPSAGCVFKNPAATPAGKLIDEIGLKGTRIGGACVSAKHGNFIVNEGGATAQDVLQLIGLVRERVRQARGIELETEVMIVGEER